MDVGSGECAQTSAARISGFMSALLRLGEKVANGMKKKGSRAAGRIEHLLLERAMRRHF